MKKNVLFVGDLRPVNNYGAVATTEMLLKLLQDENLNVNYKLIDFRSLYNPTPVDGFKTESKPCVLKCIVKKLLPTSLIKRIRNNYIGNQNNDFVPYKLSQYEDYYCQMNDGKILQYEKKLLEWADIIFINGEGNIVNGTDKFGKYRMGARYLLFMAWVGKIKFNLPTFIVNHTVDPNNYNAFEIIENVYPKLDKVLVRETLSLPLLEQHNVKNAEFVADALFTYKPAEDWQPSEKLSRQIDFSKPYICIGDSSGIRNAYNQVKWNVVDVFSEIIDKIKQIIPQVIFVDGYNGGNEDINRVIRKNKIGYVNFDNCDYHDLYQVLKRAKLFISGRWHASILCVLANTPILSWGADSHKTKSLYTLLEYPYRFFEVSTLPTNIPEMIDESRNILNNADKIKSNIKTKVEILAASARGNSTFLNQYVDKK